MRGRPCYGERLAKERGASRHLVGRSSFVPRKVGIKRRFRLCVNERRLPVFRVRTVTNVLLCPWVTAFSANNDGSVFNTLHRVIRVLLR